MEFKEKVSKLVGQLKELKGAAENRLENRKEKLETFLQMQQDSGRHHILMKASRKARLEAKND